MYNTLMDSNSSYFECKNLVIKQDQGVYKITSDAMLLALLTPLTQKEKHILEVGCGTGIISLYLAQKSQAFFHAIDINQNAVLCCSQNIINANLSHRVVVEKKAFQALRSFKTYDLIVSNPPFFGAVNKYKKRYLDQAKNAEHLPIDFFFKKAYEHLKNQSSKIVLLIPFDNYFNTVLSASSCKLFLCKKILIQTGQSKVKRVILVFSKSWQTKIKVETFTYRDKNNKISKAFKQALK